MDEKAIYALFNLREFEFQSMNRIKAEGGMMLPFYCSPGIKAGRDWTHLRDHQFRSEQGICWSASGGDYLRTTGIPHTPPPTSRWVMPERPWLPMTTRSTLSPFAWRTISRRRGQNGPSEFGRNRQAGDQFLELTLGLAFHLVGDPDGRHAGSWLSKPCS